MGNYSMKYKYEYKVDGSIHHESPFLHRRKKNCLYICRVSRDEAPSYIDILSRCDKSDKEF